MRRIGWGLVLVAAAAAAAAPAAPARADVDVGDGAEPDTLEGQQRELGLGPRTVVTRGETRWSAFAQLVGEGAADLAAGTRRGEAAAAIGAELRVMHERCELVRVGGQARLAWSGAARPSAEQWASGCLGFEVFLLELGHHLEWDVRPSLLAPLELRPGLNRRETASFRFAPFHMAMTIFEKPEAPRGTEHIALFDFTTRVSWLWSADSPGAWHSSVEAVGIRYERPQLAPWGEHRDYQVDIVAGGGESSDDGSAIAAWAVRIHNRQMGRAFVTGGIGFASASLGPIIMVGDISRHQVELTTLRALLAVETGGSQLHGYVRATNDARLGADAYVLRESRLTSGLALDASGTRAGLDGYVGFTTLYPLGAASVQGATGGAQLSLARGLGAHLEATLQLEVARSFYAPYSLGEATAGAPGTPRWGMNAMVALQATAGR
ncbi:MAG TPA: hypothetical protein VNO30_09345 [Kofleriaceae bacterium]|nr:hypothetical protein [Kofleriaceae bacterium]